jgi:predicted nucleic acid-binding protein
MSLEDHIKMLEKTIEADKEFHDNLMIQIKADREHYIAHTSSLKETIYALKEKIAGLTETVKQHEERLKKPFTQAMHKMFRRGHYKKKPQLESK